MKLRHLYIIICILISTAFYRCANQGSPMGGPKDSLAPVLIKTLPNNKSLQFKGNKIEMVFDEYIKIENLKKQLIITPRLNGEYDYTVIKNRIELKLLAPLEENTTYTFNFRDAIKDITEGNKTSNLVLVFSTGDYLDSLEITGKVNQLMDGKKSVECIVALYQASDSMDLFLGPPKYFSKTDTSGTYKLQNLKDGWYTIYAYQDKNDNTLCEPQYESYGFKSDSFLLSKNNSPNLVVYNSDIRDLKMLSSSPFTNYYEARYNKYIKEYKIQNLSNKELIYSNLEEKNRNIKIFNPGIPTTDSLQLKITATDTLNHSMVDTLYAKFRDSKVDATKLNITYGIKQSEQVDEELNFTITFNKPIRKINKDSIFLQYDSTRIEKLVPGKEVNWNFNKTELTLIKKIEKTKIGVIENKEPVITNTKSDENKNKQEPIKDIRTDIDDSKAGISGKPLKGKNQQNPINTPAASNSTRPGAQSDNKIYTSPFYLVFGKAAFISIEGDSSEASVKRLTIVNPREVASIAGKILGNETHFTVQLLDRSFKVLMEEVNKKNYAFKNIPPGDYFIRVLVDTNKNGKWELGNIKEKIEPEKVIMYNTKPISLRANFELIDNNIQL